MAGRSFEDPETEAQDESDGFGVIHHGPRPGAGSGRHGSGEPGDLGGPGPVGGGRPDGGGPSDGGPSNGGSPGDGGDSTDGPTDVGPDVDTGPIESGRVVGDGDHPALLVLGATGVVVGLAFWDAALGAYVTDLIDTTVINETLDAVSAMGGGSNELVLEPPTAPLAEGQVAVERPSSPWQFKRPNPVPELDPSLVQTDCQTVGITTWTGFQHRTLTFNIRFAASSFPGGLSADQLSDQVTFHLNLTLDKWALELPLLFSMAPFSLLGLIDDLSDSVLAPIAARVVQETVQEAFNLTAEGGEGLLAILC